MSQHPMLLQAEIDYRAEHLRSLGGPLRRHERDTGRSPLAWLQLSWRRLPWRHRTPLHAPTRLG